jgi:glycosyltransferase involved in cell wall biosynthesis
MALQGIDLRFFRFGFIPRRRGLVYVVFPDSFVVSPSPFRMAVKVSCFVVSLLFAKLIGCRLVWAINNLRSHEHQYPFVERILMKIYIPCVDATIHHSRTSLRECIEKYPELEQLPTKIIPHVNFLHIYPGRGDRARGTALLGINEDKSVLLSFGIVRRYKGIVELIESFIRITDPQLRLVIAGFPLDQEYAEEVRHAAAKDSRVLLLLREISDTELQDLFAVATLACTNFSAILNSGSVMLALSLGCPVLTPRLGSLQDVGEAVGADWLKLFDGPLDVKVLKEAIAWAKAPARGASPPLAFANIDVVVAEIVQFLRGIISNPSNERL